MLNFEFGAAHALPLNCGFWVVKSVFGFCERVLGFFGNSALGFASGIRASRAFPSDAYLPIGFWGW